MDLSTNIIRNVYNIGTNSCDAGTQYCTNEYSLYFPCLKDVTRGQNVCFDFYVADGNTKDVVDLRTVDNISLNLNGQYNCSYGTFSYPDNILSLQTEIYPTVYDIKSENRNLCGLSILMLDNESKEPWCPVDSDSDVPMVWSGTKIRLKAEDTPTHIFLGWVLIDDVDDDGCEEDTLEDNIKTTSKKYCFTITKDTCIVALYRKRKSYKVVSGNDLAPNGCSWFEVDYNNSGFVPIANRDNDGYDDSYNDEPDYQYDYIEVLEGYYMVARCVPSEDSIDDSDSDNEPNMIYNFLKWKDGYRDRCRLFKIGDDTKAFEVENRIELKTYTKNHLEPYTKPEDCGIVCPVSEFDEIGVHVSFYDTIQKKYIPIDNYVIGDDIYDLESDCESIESSVEVYRKYIDSNGYIYFHNGSLVLSSFGIENGVKINIKAYADDTCELEVKVNDFVISQELAEDSKKYEFYFTKCNNSNITITSYGDCYVDNIEVCREDLVDGGKAQFCLDAETTASIPPGNLSVNGAIAVGEMGVKDGELVVKNPQAYGLASTQIGQVNKLPKIVIYG